MALSAQTNQSISFIWIVWTWSTLYVCKCISLADPKISLKEFKNGFFPTESWKNHLKKLHTYGSWEFFFSTQNSPELHFCFINSFIQSSLLRSLGKPHQWSKLNSSTVPHRSALKVCLIFSFKGFVRFQYCLRGHVN